MDMTTVTSEKVPMLFIHNHVHMLAYGMLAKVL